MFRKRLKQSGGIGLGFLVVLLCFIIAFRWFSFYTAMQTQHKTPSKVPQIVVPRSFCQPLSTPQGSVTDFQKTTFYWTIVDNNLFRPLGWTPPRPRNPYRLLGTRTPTDVKSEARAILQSTTAGGTYTVSLGEMLSTDTTIVDIQPKQVTLEKAGVRRTLKLSTTPLLK